MSFADCTEEKILETVDFYKSKVDSWKSQHDEAMLVRDLEDLLRGMVECYAELRKCDEDYRNFVYEQPNSYSYAQDERIKTCYRRYLFVGNECEQILLAMTSRDWAVEGDAAFIDTIVAVRRMEKVDFDEDALNDLEILSPTFEELEPLLKAGRSPAA